MASQGNPPQGAPARTFMSLLMSEPIVGTDGRLTIWGGQFLQRLTSYVGPPDGTGQSLTQQLAAVIQEAQAATGGQGTSSASMAQIGGLQQAAALQPAPFPPPLTPPPIPPLASLEPWLTSVVAAPAAPSSIYAPLVNGDLPGPTPISTPDGQFIMVPVT